MPEGLPLALANGIGVVGVVFFVGWLVMSGRLIPRTTHEDTLHDRDEWRTAHRISESARLEGVEHQRAMAETANTMNQLMHELQERLRQSKLREIEGGEPT